MGTDDSRGKVIVRRVSKQFDSENPEQGLAIKDVNFSVQQNEFLTIVGRSGCGKSTMLNIIAGLLSPTDGEVLINGKRVTKPGLDRGMVFQSASLFPWLRAIENIEFGPRNIGVPKEERRSLARDLIKLVGLEGFENKYPRELSGGMQQRVAIARAMAMDPEILLMDEPFGSLDQLIFVTHSILEAIYLSDRVLVFCPHPGNVRREFRIDLPRPRQKSSTEYMAYYEEIYANIS
jgi:ABC-type nitrate/sulfonate/bicarbonate transport system ATPase subunit